MTHTPGPWKVAGNQCWGDTSFIVVARQWDCQSHVSTAFVWSDKMDDARLIAAAPALLEALKKAKFLMDEDPEEGHKIAYISIAQALARVGE